MSTPVEQVIEVPMITLDQVSQRSSLRGLQLAEQLVEVPVPEWTELARGRSALGIEWRQVALRGEGEVLVAPPGGLHRLGAVVRSRSCRSRCSPRKLLKYMFRRWWTLRLRPKRPLRCSVLSYRTATNSGLLSVPHLLTGELCRMDKCAHLLKCT